VAQTERSDGEEKKDWKVFTAKAAIFLIIIAALVGSIDAVR